MLELLFLLSVSLLVYTYAGYPLLAAILGRLLGRQPGAHSYTPPVTLLIAAYNEEDVIAERLENALSLDYPRDKLQILVAADGSDDDTASIVKSFAAHGVELSYDPARRGKMAAINRAMPRATGEIVVFSDANNMYEAQAVRRLVRPFANPQVGAAGGAKRIMKGDGALGESEGLYWRYEDFIKREESRLGTTTGVCGEILALRRNLFRAPPTATVNDDFYMALDLIARGYDVLYVGDACSYERVSPSAESERARRARIVAGRYQAMFTPSLWPRRPLPAWQVISHKYLRPLVPLAMLLALATNIMALLHASVSRERGRLLAGRSGWLLLGVQLLFYVVSWLGKRFENARGPVKVLYLPAFLVSANLAALYGEADLFVLPSRLETWGDVLLEAMAYGLPVLGVDSDAMGEIVVDGVTGRLVPPGDVEALAGALRRLCQDPELRREWGTSGRRRVERNFQWFHVAERLLPVLDDVMRASIDSIDSYKLHR